MKNSTTLKFLVIFIFAAAPVMAIPDIEPKVIGADLSADEALLRFSENYDFNFRVEILIDSEETKDYAKTYLNYIYMDCNVPYYIFTEKKYDQTYLCVERRTSPRFKRNLPDISKIEIDDIINLQEQY